MKKDPITQAEQYAHSYPFAKVSEAFMAGYMAKENEIQNTRNNDEDIYAAGRNAQSITPDDSRNDGSAADPLRDSEAAPMDDEKMTTLAIFKAHRG